MMFLSKNWYFSVQKVIIYYTVNKSHHNSFILLVFLHVANFRYVANFRFLTLTISCAQLLGNTDIICFQRRVDSVGILVSRPNFLKKKTITKNLTIIF